MMRYYVYEYVDYGSPINDDSKSYESLKWVKNSNPEKEFTILHLGKVENNNMIMYDQIVELIMYCGSYPNHERAEEQASIYSDKERDKKFCVCCVSEDY